MECARAGRAGKKSTSLRFDLIGKMTKRSYRTGQLDVDGVWRGFLQDPDWMFKTGVGGMINASCIILLILTPLLFPVVCALVSLINGYLLRVIRYKVLNPSSKLPAWDDWLELFISGLTWLAIQFGLSLVFVLIVTSALLPAFVFGSLKVSSLAFLIWAFVSTIGLVTIGLLLSFATPFLMVNFALEERVAAGLSFKQVLVRAAKNKKEFLLAWLFSIGLMWASVLVPAVTILGLFIVPSTVFVGQIFCATIWAQVWGPEK